MAHHCRSERRGRIAVTGAYGQLGREICCQLGGDALPLEIDTLDLTRRAAVIATLRDLQPSAVINCAAYTQVDLAESQPEACRRVNVDAVENLVEVCDELDCPLVQISTDYVFGGEPRRTKPFREDDLPSPQGVYARTKWEGEKAARRHARHLVVRTCGLYARPADRQANHFVKTMLALGGQRTLRVVSDQQCTPSFVPHVAEAILFLLETARLDASRWGTYHVTNQGATTWYEFAAELFRLAGVPVQMEAICTREYGAAAPRPAYSVLDTTAYHGLGGPVMPTWSSALAAYVAEWKRMADQQRNAHRG